MKMLNLRLLLDVQAVERSPGVREKVLASELILRAVGVEIIFESMKLDHLTKEVTCTEQRKGERTVFQSTTEIVTSKRLSDKMYLLLINIHLLNIDV